MNMTFAELRQHALAHRCGFEELRERFGCGRGCALCVPYVKAMLQTGRTSFSADEPPPVSQPGPTDV